MNREELMTLLPHRDGMLLLDEAEVRDGKALGKKQIRPEEFFLQGHFPGEKFGEAHGVYRHLV